MDCNQTGPGRSVRRGCQMWLAQSGLATLTVMPISHVAYSQMRMAWAGVVLIQIQIEFPIGVVELLCAVVSLTFCAVFADLFTARWTIQDS